MIEKVKNAKIWLQKQPDYLKFLQQLQDILHQKNIGAFFRYFKTMPGMATVIGEGS